MWFPAPNDIEEELSQRLARREAASTLRALIDFSELTDFYSNDYLSLSNSGRLTEAVREDCEGSGSFGAHGSRLLGGHSEAFSRVENKIAEFHKAESALIFNSGYDANLGLLSAAPSRHDTILCDELCHASIRDGARLSLAKQYSFRHNDLDDLKAKLAFARGRVFVVVESVYSMDGDRAPLRDLAQLCLQLGLNLIVDEAHAVGVFGEHGAGVACELGIKGTLFARVVTFGKALGAHGAAVLGSANLRGVLINFARPFIYTTALPPYALAAIEHAYDLLPACHGERRQLLDLIGHFLSICAHLDLAAASKNLTPIQYVLIPDNKACHAISAAMRERGFGVKGILSPTVSPGGERIRISLHAHNTTAQIDALMGALKELS